MIEDWNRISALAQKQRLGRTMCRIGAAWSVFLAVAGGTIAMDEARAYEPGLNPPTTAQAELNVAKAPVAPEPAEQGLTWLDNYADGLKQAEAAGKLLVVYFQDSAKAEAGQFERHVLSTGPVGDLLGECVLVRLAKDAKIRSGGAEVELLSHAAFSDLGGRGGLAVIDTINKQSDRFRMVVGALPVDRAVPGEEQVMALVERHLPEAALAKITQLDWHDNYSDAIRRAEAERRMLFVYFRDEPRDETQQRFDADALSSARVRRKLARFVLARLPSKTTIKSGGEPVELLKHPAFENMYGREGIAIVDTSDKESRHFRQVVSAFPFSQRRNYDADKMSVILDLPKGTLTQRTLVYAVRTHGERPASTDGKADSMLADEAESHSEYQAQIDNQGHHNWDSRFQRISARLPDGMAAQEVCAESWPGQELVDAAEECVSSWRQSSGHWSAVSGRQPLFGYDMKLGSRAVWYATGIFGRH